MVMTNYNILLNIKIHDVVGGDGVNLLFLRLVPPHDANI
jgi:hypothetical protein